MLVRYVVVLVAVLVLAAPATAADRVSARLSPIATSIVGRDVTVVCGPSSSANESGSAVVGSDSMRLAPWGCRALEGWIRGKPVNLGELAGGMDALVHEAMHLRGIADEGEAECSAYRLVPSVATTYFHVGRVRLRDLMAMVRLIREGLPAEYRARC